MRQLLRDTTFEVIRAIAPLIAVVLILQFTFVKASAGVFVQFLIGAVLVIGGMIFFLLGIEVGILPAGKLMYDSFSLFLNSICHQKPYFVYHC